MILSPKAWPIRHWIQLTSQYAWRFYGFVAKPARHLSLIYVNNVNWTQWGIQSRLGHPGLVYRRFSSLEFQVGSCVEMYFVVVLCSRSTICVVKVSIRLFGGDWARVMDWVASWMILIRYWNCSAFWAWPFDLGPACTGLWIAGFGFTNWDRASS